MTPRLIPALLAIAFAGGAHASGFALQNQNGAGTGYAFAGAAAVAEDASTIYFNPAGMAYLPTGHNFTLAASAIMRSVDFKDKGTTPYTIPLSATSAIRYPVGDDGGDGGGTALVPALYWSWAINPSLFVGLGISAPYGSETEYDKSFAGRFSSYYTSVETMNINPSIAYKFNEVVTVGFGLNYASTEVELKQAVPNVRTLPPSEAEAKIKGDDSTWGWNIGAMFQVTPTTRLGVSYRSTLDHELGGDLKVLGTKTNVTADLETPDVFSLALSQKFGTDLEILADATWTGWSSVKQLTAVSDATGRPAASVLFNYENTWRFGLGGKYQLNPGWNLRAGIAYDQTPVPDAESRTMTVPDSDRIWLSVGARWQLNKAASVDFAYAHIFFDDAPVERPVYIPGTTRLAQTIKGDFDVSANILSAQLNYNFQ
jgi:long-chain fatty acid transport protein